MKVKVRTGIIGSGFAASLHYSAIQKIFGVDVEIVGVYSPNESHRRSFADSRSIPAADSLEELVDNSTVVHVCTPVSTHESIAIMALERDTYPIVEKPLVGFCGNGSREFRGDRFPKTEVLEAVHTSIERILAAERESRAKILYAENWVFAPAIQKEREILEKSGAQILWIQGEQSHSGSHAKAYGFWKSAGGGVAVANACHPLSAALYLKRKEGLAREGVPIRPRTVSARTHEITRLPGFIDAGHLRKEYHDTEDAAYLHVEFEDGTIADISASALVLGGIYNRLTVAANNHRTICSINPNNSIQTFSPKEEYLQDVYVVEKPGTKQGWSHPAPDEYFSTGYPQEMEAFYRTAAYGDPLESDSTLAADTISTIYSAYLSAERDGRKVEIRTY
ncbi:MAG: Gfo/Idh/MocA family oxidoreductase [Spirochaetaceae bacterium]|nr:MAG: Gfo/Idh/MocA family oxidoreductase [Spirochaetaceae bacterium]